ncbi:hypothetical protein SAMN05216436_11091 [bacterium A37T11]|nr:hypothetical protein SAMN05216436_11091 [bacterium A37T11]
MKRYLFNRYLLVGTLVLINFFGLESFKDGNDQGKKAKIEKKAAVKTNVKAKTKTEDIIWFPVLAAGQTSSALSNFDTSAGSKDQNSLCNAGTMYYCAVGFPESECTETSPGVYELNTTHSSGTYARYNP